MGERKMGPRIREDTGGEVEGWIPAPVFTRAGFAWENGGVRG